MDLVGQEIGWGRGLVGEGEARPCPIDRIETSPRFSELQLRGSEVGNLKRFVK